MRISIVVAVAANGVIGRDNALPWHLPADLRHFREITLGKPVVMGRRTYESIGRPLQGRVNIVVTRRPAFRAPGCVVVNSAEAALRAARGAAEVMVIGGATLYAELLPRATRIYLTLVHAVMDGDTRFPELPGDEWVEAEREDHEPDARNPCPFSFLLLERRTPAA
jgi:dihydrofolate reductase